MEKRQHNGFALIEVLISVFVLALGVIGVAGMQLTALRTTQQSAFQSTALQLASEMADRMRANDKQVKLGGKDNPFLNVAYPPADGKHKAPNKFCYSDDCSAEELAKFDIYEWEKRVKAALPGGRALICRDATPWDAAKGALTWNCDAGTGDSASFVIKLGWRGKGKNPDGSLIADESEPFPPSVAITVKPYIK
jgi:type IV pilus assembly protein PilV